VAPALVPRGIDIQRGLAHVRCLKFHLGEEVMNVGYFPCTQDPPNGANIGAVLRESIVEAQVAEESGFDSCLFSEHHQQEDGYVPNVILMAGMVGVATKKIKVGTCVTLIPLWHPVHVAEDAAIVDQMTG